ncbi:MAG: hypothetical protein HY077_02820 [Elusimicrobia bacterium]|nr:hypothetical protein [Elusimicrobiota bacterium]
MKRLGTMSLAALLLAGCSQQDARRPAESVFVGVDVSGSFHDGGHFESSLEFLSHYLYGRLTGQGGLAPVKTLYVGSIGGEYTEESKSFYPIHSFQGKSPEQIQADLRDWFPKSDKYTDFNIFFKQVAQIAEKRNLSLSPITIVLLSDGVPDIKGMPEVPARQARFDMIDLGSLEYLSRRVTVRLLFSSPIVAARWESAIKRQRVRVWTVDEHVMEGWKAQYEVGKPPEQQDKLWRWINDNVDYRVRGVKFGLRRAKASASADEEAEAAPKPPPKPPTKSPSGK